MDTATTIRVRPAGTEDLPALSTLFDAYRVFYEQPSDTEAALAFLGERITHLQSVLFIAEVEQTGAPVGFTQLYPAFSSVSLKRTWILNDLFVRPEFRGQQAGRALLEAARNFAIQTGAKGILLETGTGNTRAQQLYERFGFQREEASYFYFLRL